MLIPSSKDPFAIMVGGYSVRQRWSRVILLDCMRAKESCQRDKKKQTVFDDDFQEPANRSCCIYDARWLTNHQLAACNYEIGQPRQHEG